MTLARPAIRFLKAPTSGLRYGFDVEDVLAPGDSVVAVEILEAVGATASNEAYIGTAVFCKVAAGAEGHEALVTLGWRTAQGDNDSRTMSIRLRKR